MASKFQVVFGDNSSSFFLVWNKETLKDSSTYRPIMNIFEVVVGSGARFSKVPVTFQPRIEIKRIRARVLDRKLLHFVSLTDSFIMLDAKLFTLLSSM